MSDTRVRPSTTTKRAGPATRHIVRVFVTVVMCSVASLRRPLALVCFLALAGAQEKPDAASTKTSAGVRASSLVTPWDAEMHGIAQVKVLSMPEKRPQRRPAQLVHVFAREAGQDEVIRLRDALVGNGLMVPRAAPAVGRLTVLLRSPEDLAAIVARPDVLFIGEAGLVGRAPRIARQTLNLDARDTHAVDVLQKRYKVSGAGVHVGVWDGDGVLVNHVELRPRASQRDGAAAPADHATHVAGTVGAKGVEPLAMGMAPDAILECFDWHDDVQELVTACDEHGVVCSNHSYGFLRGWVEGVDGWWRWYGDPNVDGSEDYLYGKYDATALAFDRVIESRPGLCIFIAAGNERSRLGNDPYFWQGPSWDGLHYVPELGAWSREKRKPDDFDDGGYDTLEGAAVAKNTICVGAIEDITKAAPTADKVKVTDFSSWGPTDDGRVKPDVVANGRGLYSTSVVYDDSGGVRDDGYMPNSGTSMASPTAAGIGVLLQEHAKATRKRFLCADEMKATLVHTAMSPHQGPTYQIGWGAIRADLAGDLIAGKDGSLQRVALQEGLMRWQAIAKGKGIARVTLVWIDPPSVPNAGGLDDRATALSLDLNVALVRSDGRRFLPWSLDPASPSRPATRDKPNHVDNVERIDAEVEAGEWAIEIEVPAAAAKRHAALAVSGLELPGK